MNSLPDNYSPDSCHWCYQVDARVAENSHHRQEWCVRCGTTRVRFHLGWSYQVSDLARQYPCTGKGAYLSAVPERALAPVQTKRLGRGLKELMAQRGPATIKGLFPPPKK